MITDIYQNQTEKDQTETTVLNEILEVETINEIEKEDQIKIESEESEPKNINQNITENQENILSFQSKEIDCIVIFYNDGSFKKYNP